MQHTRGVDVAKRREELARERLRVGDVAGLDPLAQVPAGDVLHHQEGALVGLEVVDRDEVGVLEPRGDVGLAPEAV